MNNLVCVLFHMCVGVLFRFLEMCLLGERVNEFVILIHIIVFSSYKGCIFSTSNV